jgi:natural resistance-associated macrophage protein
VCGDFGLESEGYALKSKLGSYTLYLWAVGLFAAGQAATMVCTYAGQIIMGGCLEIQLAPWVRVAITRIFALGPALVIAAATASDQKLFNSINEYLNILQSIQLPFAMLPVLHFASKDELLGRFRSGTILSVISTALALLVIVVSVVLVVQFVMDNDTPPWAVALVALYGVCYFGVCLRMVWSEVVSVAQSARRLLTCQPTATPLLQTTTVTPLPRE